MTGISTKKLSKRHFQLFADFTRMTNGSVASYVESPDPEPTQKLLHNPFIYSFVHPLPRPPSYQGVSNTNSCSYSPSRQL